MNPTYIKIWLSDPYFVVEPTGDIDSTNSDLLAEAFWLQSLYPEREVFLCMNNVTYISSAGIGTILGNLKAVQDLGTQLRAGGLQQTIRDIFDLMDVGRFIDLDSECEYGDPVVAGFVAEGNLNNLVQIRAFVKEFLSEEKISPIEINKISVMVDEICSNLARYTKTQSGQNNIVITLQHIEDTISVRIMDRGEYFDPSQYTSRPIEELIENGVVGGMGLRIVNQLASEINYSKWGERNVCQFIRTLEN
jgi:serine/threonine-protein kinase RsbW